MFFSRGVTPSNLSGITNSSLLSSSVLQSSSGPSSSNSVSFVSSQSSSTPSSLLGSSSSVVTTFNTSSTGASFSGTKKIANDSLSLSSASYRKFFLFAALSGLSAFALWWAHKRYYKKQSKLAKVHDNLKGSIEEKKEEAPLLDSVNQENSQQVKMAAEPKTKVSDRTDCSQPEDCTVVVAPNAQDSDVDQSVKNDMKHFIAANSAKVHSGPQVSQFDNCTRHKSFDWADEVDKELSNRLAATLLQKQSTAPASESSAKQAPATTSQQDSETVAAADSKQQMASGHSPRGYKTAESPSTNSEGSADSGRATGGLTSASPFDVENTLPPSIPTSNRGMVIPYYEFEIPNSLVGLIIGVGGKTIKELCMRTGVKMLIRPHHTLEKLSTHQICSVEGKRENINRCLHMIKGRFPKERFPDLNLKPVIPPVISPTTNQLRPQIIPLTLPVGVPCEVFVSSTVDPGHFFVQLPTHPSFCSLEMLNCFMLQCYGPGGTPELPRPVNLNIVCAAPAYSGWFRALTVYSYPEQDEVLVKFVDYGGYARIPAADLRQIRTDFLSYPMQAVECHLAYVEPVDGTAHWSDEAGEVFQKMCGARIIQAEVIGFSKTPERVPYVVLYFVDENKKVHRIDNLLLEKGLAKMADPTRMEPATKPSSNAQKSTAEQD